MQKKTAVVTGAGRGLGRLIARGVADKGFEVLVTDIDAESARRTAEEIGPRAWAMAQDVRDPAGHEAVARAASERGALELWINNAGVLKTGAVWDLDEAEVRRHLDVNVLGVIWGCRAAVAAMRRQGGDGHIINIASISSLVPAPGLAVYGASKHAVLGFSISLQGDLQRAGIPIKVSALCPDAIDTELVRANAGDDEASLLFTSRHLLTPEHVAAEAVALVDRPRLMSVVPFRRGLLAHAFRPFPWLGLKILGHYEKVGDRNRRRARGAT